LAAALLVSAVAEVAAHAVSSPQSLPMHARVPRSLIHGTRAL
jgi:hypothetical protein